MLMASLFGGFIVGADKASRSATMYLCRPNGLGVRIYGPRNNFQAGKQRGTKGRNYRPRRRTAIQALRSQDPGAVAR